jgi:hypothetical protein
MPLLDYNKLGTSFVKIFAVEIAILVVLIVLIAVI